MIDITRFSLETIAVWIVAFFIIEFPIREIYVNMGENGFFQRWYGFKEFNPITVIVTDAFYFIIAILISYRIHEYFFKDIIGFEKRFLYFFFILLIVQNIIGIIFYYILVSLPQNYRNKWVKFFIDYGNNAKINALFSDSIYILAWTIAAYFVRFLPYDILLLLFFFYIFVITAISN